MNAEKRLEKVREHIEIAYGHDNFRVRELENTEEKVKAVVSTYFTDKERTMEFVFGGGNITKVKKLGEEP